jgi:signal transduction histidine kinase
MNFWTVDHLFLANALLLLMLGTFLVIRKKSALTWIFLVTNVGLAAWNICIFLVDQGIWAENVRAIIKVQLLAAMVNANGLYYFCSSYPVFTRTRFNLLNGMVAALFAIAIVFTSQVTSVEVVDGELVYADVIGYSLYSAYLSLLGFVSLYRLIQARRKYPEHRGRIRYFLIGLSIYVCSAITFNLVLPSLAIYDFLIIGRLSATSAPLFFFYAITKHEFLDVTVIINKTAAWLTTIGIILVGTMVINQVTAEWQAVNLLALGTCLVLAAIYGHDLQQFLLTSARRKFIRGWYSTTEVINQLAIRLTLEKNREAIFQEITAVLDRVFELEDTLCIVAVRSESGNFAYYKVQGKFQKIRTDDAMVKWADNQTTCVSLADVEDRFVLQRLGELGVDVAKDGVILPFHSPEYLEGLVILGEKGSKSPYSVDDLRFFDSLISFTTPVLYRLTPFEKLEKLYNENTRKLHEAEIQLIRAQKIESIAHATRQCHHEIRTPLNIIKLGINRIRSMEELESYKSVAREEIEHALEIVDETLALTDLTDVSAREYAEVNVNEVINRCLRLVDYSKYKVVLDLNEVPSVLANFSELQVVFTNLIHNAMDAMPDGGTLAFSSSSDGEAVNLVVEDTGEGIAEELRSRVWEPYFSGKLSDAGNTTAGRGWGLTIVNRIINEHKGTIRFSSELGVGTRFNISLPLIVTTQSAEVVRIRAEKVS